MNAFYIYLQKWFIITYNNTNNLKILPLKHLFQKFNKLFTNPFTLLLIFAHSNFRHILISCSSVLNFRKIQMNISYAASHLNFR